MVTAVQNSNAQMNLLGSELKLVGDSATYSWKPRLGPCSFSKQRLCAFSIEGLIWLIPLFTT